VVDRLVRCKLDHPSISQTRGKRRLPTFVSLSEFIFSYHLGHVEYIGQQQGSLVAEICSQLDEKVLQRKSKVKRYKKNVCKRSINIGANSEWGTNIGIELKQGFSDETTVRIDT
jgi:hypothetical protein